VVRVSSNVLRRGSYRHRSVIPSPDPWWFLDYVRRSVRADLEGLSNTSSFLMLTSLARYKMVVALSTDTGPSTARQCLNTETTGGSQAFVGKRCCLLDNVALSKSLGCIALVARCAAG
jgi:hypothetical protein